ELLERHEASQIDLAALLRLELLELLVGDDHEPVLSDRIAAHELVAGDLAVLLRTDVPARERRAVLVHHAEGHPGAPVAGVELHGHADEAEGGRAGPEGAGAAPATAVARCALRPVPLGPAAVLPSLPLRHASAPAPVRPPRPRGSRRAPPRASPP